MDYHDVLAAVGAGSAHPGGFSATSTWLSKVNLRPEDRVLDVGCGTGRTLVEIQKRFQCQVTGIDIRKQMIRKARRRSELMSVPAEWRVGSIERLPFADGTFDVVLTESVNVFVSLQKSLRECYRVLRTGGTYIDIEMMVNGPVPDGFYDSARAMYGALQVPDLKGWKQAYRDGGFDNVDVIGTFPVQPEASLSADQQYPDPLQLNDPDAFSRPTVMEVLRRNSTWLEQNQRWLGYGIFRCSRLK